MKAFLLAAGFGTRLRPLTDSIPKCLVKIGDKPLLEYWLILLEKYGIRDVLINLHYLPDKVNDFLADAKHKYDINITAFYEDKLLGSAGTIRENRSWLGGDENFLVLYADNLTNVNLETMIESHMACGQPILTMGLAKTERPSECGIAVLDSENLIVEFEEKPAKPKSDLANIGMYVTNQAVFKYIDQAKTPCDFGFDVLPKLVGKMCGFVTNDYVLDIGNHARYQQAQQDIQQIIF